MEDRKRPWGLQFAPKYVSHLLFFHSIPSSQSRKRWPGAINGQVHSYFLTPDPPHREVATVGGAWRYLVHTAHKQTSSG